jgi:hypothetical protein
MDRSFWILTGIFITGFVILVLPDNGTPVIILNKKHRLSSVDLAGLSLMLGRWLISYFLVVIRWKKVQKRFGKSNTYLLCVLYFVLVSGIGTGLMVSSEWILWSCAVIAFLINVAFLVPAFRRNL